MMSPSTNAHSTNSMRWARRSGVFWRSLPALKLSIALPVCHRALPYPIHQGYQLIFLSVPVPVTIRDLRHMPLQDRVLSFRHFFIYCS